MTSFSRGGPPVFRSGLGFCHSDRCDAALTGARRSYLLLGEYRIFCGGLGIGPLGWFPRIGPGRSRRSLDHLRRVREAARSRSRPHSGRESVVLFAGHLGQEKLWQQVFFGFFTFAVAVFFLAAGIIKKRALTSPGWWLECLLVAFFLANSVLALRGLRMLPTAEKPPVSGTNSGIGS